MHHAGMTPELLAAFDAHGGVTTFAQIVDLIGRRSLQRLLRTGAVTKLWANIYCLGKPTASARLRGMDLRCGEPVAVCLGTAAGRYGFDTEGVTAVHVINPDGHLLRHGVGVMVHRRDGAPLITHADRPVTAPAWTAIEVARGLGRPRALATLDAALRSGHCDIDELAVAAKQQAGRRGIVVVREMIPLARSQAESPMESEARLAMLDGGLPEPILQYEIIDRDGRRWRLDFAWPDQRVAVEFDGFEYHSSSRDLRRDRQKRAALIELGWQPMGIVSDDVRNRPEAMVRQIRGLLGQSVAA